ICPKKMATNGCDVNQLDSNLLLPPRKRLLAGFKKQNSNGSSSSSTSYSNGSSSSASTVVQTHLDSLLTSHQSPSPEELKATAALAVKIAKAARAAANEKAIIASKAVAAAKSALELFASFPAETDLARRLNQAIKNSPRVLTGHRNKKLKSVATYENDVAGVVDSDTSTDDDEVDRTRVNGKEKTGEGSSSLGKRRGRVKLKKLPLSMCASKDQENGIITNSLAQTGGSSGGVGQ
ncbi:hypothetical protein HID58_054654, partial [Brassica napus]